MDQKRRDFIKLSATLGAGLAVGSMFNGLTACNAATTTKAGKAFGLQLYTLRDVIEKDPKGLLKQVAGFGYTQLESYHHDRIGVFLGMKHTELKKYLDDIGLTMVSSHYDIDKDYEKMAAQAAEIGMEYLIVPWLGPQKKLDDYKRAADKFNRMGQICKKNGLRFAYHNHDYTFKTLEGQIPQDVLMQNTDKDLVDYEMDIYWVVTAGDDPVKWFNKYPNRFTLCHIKDRKKNVPASVTEASTIIGTGQIDFKQILKEGQSKGLKHLVVEQELYENTTPIEATKANAAYMKQLDL